MRRFAAVALLALAFPAVASAHATLESTTPKFGTEVQRSPGRIELHFDQVVSVVPGSIRVLDDNGKDFAHPATTDGTTVTASLPPLSRGSYTVRWQAISADSHVVSGVWTFGVGVPAAAVGDAFGAGGPTTIEHVVRWIWFLGLALTIGSLGLRLVVLRGLEVPIELDRKIAVAAGIGALVSLEAGIAAFSFRGADVLQQPFGRFLYGDLSPVAATRFGQAFIGMTLGYALVLALVYLSWLLDDVRLLVPALLIALVFAAGLSVSGHDAVDPGSFWLTELADWVHIAAASLWIGGLAVLAGLVWSGAPALRRAAFARFSRLATVLIVLVLVAGIYLAVVRLQHLSDLWVTGYGQVLLVKIALVCGALGWGGLHRFFVGPALERRPDGGFLTRVGRSLIGESLVGVAVLLVAAVLVDSRPPAPAPPTSPAAAALR